MAVVPLASITDAMGTTDRMTPSIDRRHASIDPKVALHIGDGSEEQCAIARQLKHMARERRID
jgi:hypothetical protein